MPPIKGKDSGYLERNENRYLGYNAILCVFLFSLAIPGLIYHLHSWAYNLLMVVAIAYTVRFAPRFFEAARKYRSGIEGEEAAIKELEKLPEHTFVIRDVHLPGMHSNIDTVVVAPGGIFAVEVKNNRYCRVGYKHGRLMCGNTPFENDFLKQARGNAHALHAYLKTRLSKDFWVMPVVIFSHRSAKVEFGLTPIDGVVRVIGLRWVRLLFLETFPPRFRDKDILEIYRTLKTLIAETND